MRSFIGIDFNRETKDGIAAVQAIIRNNSKRGRFKYIGNFHLTLKFLGDIEDNNVVRIGRTLRECASQISSFDICVDDIGLFSGRDSIHALWLGLGGNTDALLLLNGTIEQALSGLGFKKEVKPYIPHITIAQDLILERPFEELKKQIDLSCIKPIKVSKIELIKSEQIGNKRVYTPINIFPLKNVNG
ncbi:MAG: RNA 2',3'-cyclic phosphodiesterase [Bacillota bacterium]